MFNSKLPITLDQRCLNHQNQTQDKYLTMKLFKLACLAYNPSSVTYRDNIMERADLIKMRRNLIDKVTTILPQCEIFKKGAIYPKRYFDDMMIEDRGLQDQLQNIKSMEELKNIQNQYSTSKNTLNMNHISSTNIDTDQMLNSGLLGHSIT